MSVENCEERVGSWTQTFSGVQFWPLDPRPEEIFIEDIAHSLALQCRFGGHCLKPYSVAEHSVRVSMIVPPEDAFWGLLHDAAEAYIVDVPRPLKQHLKEYKAIEVRLMHAIAERFGLLHPQPASVTRADEVMLMTEKRDLMSPAPAPWGFAQGVAAEPLEEVIHPWSAEEAETRFLARFYELVDRGIAHRTRRAWVPEGDDIELKISRRWLLAFLSVLRTGMRYELQSAPLPNELRTQLDRWCEENRFKAFRR